jgi:hypothetical protein
MLELSMKQLLRARAMTLKALLMAALCCHLLIAGLSAGALIPEPNSRLTHGLGWSSVAPRRDALAAPRQSARLVLRQSPNRADSFTAALSSLVTPLALAGRPAPAIASPVAQSGGALLLTAIRAPPLLAV